MGKKGPLWWRESDWLLRGSSAANQILLRHSGPILSAIGLIDSVPETFSSLSTVTFHEIKLIFIEIMSMIILITDEKNL